jgi:hypothetical protein
MRFKVFMAVKMLIVVFWVVTPCSVTSGYQHFGEIYHLIIRVKLPLTGAVSILIQRQNVNQTL